VARREHGPGEVEGVEELELVDDLAKSNYSVGVIQAELG